jgi:hypothetical protein
MNSAIIAMLAVPLIIVVGGYFLTTPVEIRAQRWPCILISIPLALIILNATLEPARGIAGILAISSFAYLWKKVFAHYAGEGVMRLITGNLDARSGITPDLRRAKWNRKEGRLKEAIAELVAELEKDRFDVEAVVLLADLHQENQDLFAAHKAIEGLFKSGRLAGVQIDMIAARKTKLEEKILIAQLNAGK